MTTASNDAIPEPRPGWDRNAICTSYTDPDLWFPEGVRGATFVAQANIARKICRSSCPVMLDCLHAEMRAEKGKGRDNRFGVRGGMTGSERWDHERELQRIHAGQQGLAA